MATKIESDYDLKIYDKKQHYRIFAGPGAGKTHLLIQNIKLIVEHSVEIKFGIKKVLCITYTNAAADEILKRLGSYAKYVVVSTIHSFINEFIFQQFQLQLKLQIKENFDINVLNSTNIQSQQEGFSTLSGKSKEEIYAFLSEKYPTIDKSEYSDLSKNKMTKVIINIDPINQVSSTGEEEVEIESNGLSADLTFAIKDYIWSVAGKLSFDEILYYGWKLVSGYDLIRHMLRVEFPYILIDEYQDTNPIQNLIIRKISEKGVIIVIVGDIAQSIYSFQGASYLDFKNFRLPSPLAIGDFVIEGNRRSTENIIKLLNYIRQEDKTLETQYCAKNIKLNEPITFIIQKDKNHPVIPIRNIIGQDVKILCRKWDEAFNYISNISETQKKLLKSISSVYTYQLSRDLFTEVEVKQENWIRLASVLSDCEKAYDMKCLPMFLDVIGKYLNVKDSFSAFDINKGEKLNALIELWRNTFSFISEDILLKDLSFKLNEGLKNTGFTILEELKYPAVGDDEYFEPIYKHIDKITFQTAKVIINEIFTDDSNYMTIHRSKGKEFDSVLVNGEPFAKEKDFAQVMNVVKKPVIISNTSNENDLILEEYTRLLYVGYSRAINKLYIHLFGNEELEENIKRIMKDYYQELDSFYDFKYC